MTSRASPSWWAAPAKREAETGPPADAQSESNATQILIWTLAGIFLASAILLALVVLCLRPVKDTIPYEFAKALIQLGLVAVAGAAVSVLLFEHQRRRQKFDKRQEEDREEGREKERDERRGLEAANDLRRKSMEDKDNLLKSMMSRAVASYNMVKRSRRLLRARGRTDRQIGFDTGAKPTVKLRLRSYDEHVDLINSAQLELETLIREVDINRDRIVAAGPIIAKLTLMEKYLGRIVGEYEDERGQFHEDLDRVDLAKLPVVASFLEPTKDDKTFKSAFSKPLKTLLELAGQNLSGRNTAG